MFNVALTTVFSRYSHGGEVLMRRSPPVRHCTLNPCSLFNLLTRPPYPKIWWYWWHIGTSSIFIARPWFRIASQLWRTGTQQNPNILSPSCFRTDIVSFYFSLILSSLTCAILMALPSSVVGFYQLSFICRAHLTVRFSAQLTFLDSSGTNWHSGGTPNTDRGFLCIRSSTLHL